MVPREETSSLGVKEGPGIPHSSTWAINWLAKGVVDVIAFFFFFSFFFFLEKEIDHQKSRQKFFKMERGVLIREQLLPPPCPEAVNDLLEVAMVQHNLAKYHLSVDTYLKAQALWATILEAQNGLFPLEVEIFFLNAIGAVYESQGADDMALDHYNEGIRLGAELPDGHPEEALSFVNVACIYYHLMQFKHARALFEKARTIREEILGIFTLVCLHCVIVIVHNI